MLIVEPQVSQDALPEFLSRLADEGIRTVYADPGAVGSTGLATMHPSSSADYAIGEAQGAKKKGRIFQILSNADIDRMMREAQTGLDFVVAEVKDWKIIPLENIVAKIRKLDAMVFAVSQSPAEVRKMFSILEVGVDGVIFRTSSIDEVREAQVYMGTASLKLVPARVVEIREAGDGERVCVDTASMLSLGEGMLIGSRSNFLFLVHNESVGSSFTSPRPFRVNAGAVHCYTILPDGKTNYLSELETGSEVLIANTKGGVRRATVGRSKIERRPMLVIKAEAGSEAGGIIAQDAETIRFVRPDGDLVSVTHLKVGDSILAYSKPAAGRHFGMEVSDEYILEK